MRRPPFPNHDDAPGFGGPRHGRGRGSRRRGDIRTALLLALSEAPAHGYELIQRIEAKSGRAPGARAPAPCTPPLQLLEDEGLVTGTEQDGKRIYVDHRRRPSRGPAPIGRSRRCSRGAATAATTSAAGGSATTMRDLHIAARQVAVAGPPAQVEQGGRAAGRHAQAPLPPPRRGVGRDGGQTRKSSVPPGTELFSFGRRGLGLDGQPVDVLQADRRSTDAPGTRAARRA